MIYKFDKTGLTYKKITGKVMLMIIGIAILVSSIVTLFTYKKVNDIRYISTETKSIIIKEHNEFSETKLKDFILSLKIKYPNIVMAQAQIETGGFTSKIFKENNNLFGMKLSFNRPSTAKMAQYDHAYYTNWKESVYDYALYSACYLKNIHTEGEYLEYLRQNYAEDPNYVNKIKNIIDKEEKNLVALN